MFFKSHAFWPLSLHINQCLRLDATPNYTDFVCFEKHPVLSLCGINQWLVAF